MDARKSAIFCVSVCKTNFTDHHTLNTIHSFRDSVLVCKIHGCYPRIRKNTYIPSHQAMLAITMERLDKKNHFKILLIVFSPTYTYSNCIVYQLLYCWKITEPTFVAKVRFV